MSRFFSKVSLQEKILFSRHLSIGLKSGMTLINSIKMIRNQPHTKFFKKILDVLINDITNGIFLSKSLEKFKSIFGELFINIIKIAETSGTLPENLNYLAQELRKRHELKSKVRGALIYPIIILIATIAIATSMVIFVFPKLLPLFQSLQVELPLPTKILLFVANFLRDYGIWLLLGLIVSAIIFRISLKFRALRFLFHRLLISVPLFGKNVVNLNLVNSARTLALLLHSGVKIVEAITITSDTLTNLVYKKQFTSASDVVRKGEFLSKHFGRKKKYFPAVFINMVEVGENTGNLTDNLNYLAEYYEGEVDDFVRNLSGIIEPILLIFMGVVVGFIALAFITPMYKLTQGIR